MPADRQPADSVVVVGGGLAGMAAAARLAKAGHHVELFEAADRLGGCCAAHQVDGVLVDQLPSVIGFPAPWRDLFRKSGRPLEAELARTGHRLVPAPPARYVFADGQELVLPTDRGEQHAALSSAYGTGVADRWQRLVDALDDTWQLIRPLGLEFELPPRRRTDRRILRQLRPRRSLEALAQDFDHPQLSQVIRSIAYRSGSKPSATPAWCAVELSAMRRFGRWTIADESSRDCGRTSVLVEALVRRCAVRRVAIHLNQRVTSITVDRGNATGITLEGGNLVQTSHLVCTVDPWQVFDQLLPRTVARRVRRNLRRLRPYQAPTTSYDLTDAASDQVTETTELRDGLPRVIFCRPHRDGTIRTTFDFHATQEQASAGVAWQGFASWFRRPPVSGTIEGLTMPGPHSPAGSGLSQTLLSAALASYAAAEDPRYR